MPLFPIFLKLTGRPCIVIGGGNLAESKIDSLRAEAGEIVWHQRAYAAGDLAGQFLAVAATSDAAVNRAVFAEAEAAGILVNAVDDPPFCDFYFPSVVRRGDLQIAISTAGASPALAQRLRKEIDALLPLDAGEWLASRDLCGFEGCPTRALARRHAQTNPLQNDPTQPNLLPSNPVTSNPGERKP